ncbi:MAG: hypothetical protein U5L04_06370 [Trueperaceae bacterium]|nr:hypothetical protein [Trueperaceae bacterium]
MADTVKDSTYRSEKYNPHELEPRWQQQWQADKTYHELKSTSPGASKAEVSTP